MHKDNYRIQYTQYKERRNTDGTDLVFSKFYKRKSYLESLYIEESGGMLPRGSIYGREPHNHSRLLSLVATSYPESSVHIRAPFRMI